MAGGLSVSFEVYYLQYGRWQIHHRYSMSERDEAIEEAKRLDSGHFEASCVVRESYDAGTGNASESVIYHSPTLKGKPPVTNITSGQGGAAAPAKAAGGDGGGGVRAPIKNAPAGSAAANAMADARKKAAAAKAAAREAAARQPKPVTRPKKVVVVEEPDWAKAVPKLLVAFIVACFAGTIAGVLMYFAVRGLAGFGLSLGKQFNQFALIGAWLFGWVATFVPLLRKILASVTNRKPVTVDPAAFKGTGQSPLPPVNPRIAEQALSNAAEALAEKSGTSQDTSQGTSEEAPLDDPSEDNGSSFDEPEVTERSETPAQVGGGPDALRAALGVLVEEAKRRTGNALSTDQFLRFGVILFLAGASESLARHFKVANRDATNVLSEQIESLGVSASMALGFAANIDEYLLDQRYFDMYSMGRSGALSQIKGSPESGMRQALEEWRKPKPAPGQEQAAQQDPNAEQESKHFDGQPGEEENYGFVAVLFTDIVNSTKKQQENGDAWLMNVVRAHNDIVREAIAKHGGREIKHTGDGIMASYPAVIGSVESALLMQDGIQKFSEMMPELGFEICIGISAGEPIHESGDLFGTPVNLAARVLSKASAHETAVSNIVREMCRGKSFKFEEMGRYDLKGFEEPVPIYRVMDRRAKARGSSTVDAAAATPASAGA